MDEALQEMYDELAYVERQIEHGCRHTQYREEFYQELYARRREINNDIKRYKEMYQKENSHG